MFDLHFSRVCMVVGGVLEVGCSGILVGILGTSGNSMINSLESDDLDVEMYGKRKLVELG